MSNEIKSEYKDQIAEMILRARDGSALDVISPVVSDNGVNEFVVGNIDTKERYIISITIEEL
jgi:hypothetical protein